MPGSSSSRSSKSSTASSGSDRSSSRGSDRSSRRIKHSLRSATSSTSRVSTLSDRKPSGVRPAAVIKLAATGMEGRPSKETIQQNLVWHQTDQPKGDLKFEGEVRFADSKQTANAWLGELLRVADRLHDPLVVGFDTETPVTWTKGVKHRVALVQLCYHPPYSSWPICMLLQLSKLGFSDNLVKVLEHPNIIKTGMAIAGDVQQLQRDYPEAATCNAQGLMDLNWLAHACGVYKPLPAEAQEELEAKVAAGLAVFPNNADTWGLAALLQHTTGFSLKKGRVVRSNWAANLTQAQLDYACADALASLLCCLALKTCWVQQELDREQRRLELDGRLDLRAAWSASGPLCSRGLAAAKQMPLWILTTRGGAQLWKDIPSEALASWQAIMEHGCAATAQQVQVIKGRVAAKDELGDPLDWHLGVFYDVPQEYTGYCSW